MGQCAVELARMPEHCGVRELNGSLSTASPAAGSARMVYGFEGIDGKANPWVAF